MILNTLIFSHKYNYCENCTSFSWEYYQELYLILEKHGTMAYGIRITSTTCLLEFAFAVLKANMYQRRSEIPFNLEASVIKLVEVIASVQDGP